MMPYKFILFFVVLQLLQACSSTTQVSQPIQANWIENDSRNKNYPSTVYLRGYALSTKLEWEKLDDFLERVSNLARKELIESIQVHVQNESVLNVKEDNNNNYSHTNSNYQVKSQSSSNIELANIVLDKHYDPQTKTGYAFAFVKRDEVLRFYSNIIAQHLQTIEANIAEGNQYASEQQTQKALQTYARSIALFKSMQPASNILNALKANDESIHFQNRMAKDWALLHNQINESITKEHFVLSSNDKGIYEGAYQEPLSQTLHIKAHFVGSRGNIIAPNIPIEFYQDSFVFCNSLTNQEGVGTCAVRKLISKNKMQSISAKVNLTNFLNADASISNLPVFQNISNTISFAINVNKIKIYIQSQEKSVAGIDNSIPYVESKIKALLSNHECVFVESNQNPNYQINIDITPNIANVGNDIVIVYLNASLSIIEKKNQTEIYKNSYQVKGASIDLGKALLLANKKLGETIQNNIQEWRAF